MRIPRKLKKKIPKNTPYCYLPDYEKNAKEIGWTYWIKPCPFYQPGGWCKIIKDEIEDQCKSCGVN